MKWYTEILVITSNGNLQWIILTNYVTQKTNSYITTQDVNIIFKYTYC